MSSDASALSSVVCKWMYVDTSDTREIRDMRHERQETGDRIDTRDAHKYNLSSVVCKWIYVLYCVTYISLPPTRFERCVCMPTHTDVNTLKHRHKHTQTQTKTHSNT